ncbi:MAPEG family protein [Aurantiacibacter gangjinensis]|uniref:Membrane protein n=1 Tax=Aurantiacibacter gangjinensis TaxID=502682 RepID=A0A0G9MM89_9SPHN|nr:MAPEG family protein [Aurantiacibacter gangjinensis]APE27822.1 Inner membrane protein [Aurantiacibacter gangjinensis]KLE31805.1 membrane protein [Aurantiacibacter gangjinensis]
MPTEMTVLALSGLLLLAHIFSATHYKTKQYGLDWNMGARDEDKPPLNDLAARLDRARGNFLETLPLAIIGFGGVVMTGTANEWTAIAAWVWLAARVIYLPIYWSGIAKVRTYVWTVSLLALLVPIGVLLLGAL